MKIAPQINLQKLYLKYVFGKYLFFIGGILLPCLKASSQAYFQQDVNYKILVTLDDRKHELNGSEIVKYLNNSPDTLSFLYFHLWPNAYSNNKTELAKQIIRFNGKSKLFDDPQSRGYIDSLNFEVDGNDVQWSLLPGFPDICKIILNKPLSHGDSVCITTPFHLKIPTGLISLLGHIGNHTRSLSGTQNRQYMTDQVGIKCHISIRVSFFPNLAAMM